MNIGEEARKEGLPLSAEFVNGDYLRRYLMGEVGAREANTALRKTLADPELLFRAFYEFADIKIPLKTMFDTALIRSNLEKLIAASKGLGEAKTAYAKARRAHMKTLATSDLPAEMKRALYFAGPKPSELAQGIRAANGSSVELRLGEDRSHMVWAYLESRVAGAKFADSDMVDLAHATYLPLCDLWRGDRSFATMLIAARVPHSSKIVPSLLDLPARVEELFALAHPIGRG